MGLTVSSLTSDIREQFELKDSAAGVMVVRVDGGSGAAEKGIQPGDVIIEVGQQEVSSPTDVISRVNDEKSR